MLRGRVVEKAECEYWQPRRRIMPGLSRLMIAIVKNDRCSSTENVSKYLDAMKGWNAFRAASVIPIPRPQCLQQSSQCLLRSSGSQM